ncbi:7534_t:CDS:2, partial [Racocetra persica]
GRLEIFKDLKNSDLVIACELDIKYPYTILLYDYLITTQILAVGKIEVWLQKAIKKTKIKASFFEAIIHIAIDSF